VEQNGFKDSYQSVQRFVRKLKATQPQRVWRMEARPGEEIQVDFGLGAPIYDGAGRARRSWVFRMVLSYSRKPTARVASAVSGQAPGCRSSRPHRAPQRCPAVSCKVPLPPTTSLQIEDPD
jgi:hypothetical protein